MKMRSMVAGIVACALVTICGNEYVGAGVITLNFNTDGVSPASEMASVAIGSTVARVQSGASTDSVSGGNWNLNPAGVGPSDSGFVFYDGDVPALASNVANTQLSINTRLRVQKDISSSGSEFYFNLRGPDGMVWLYLNYDSAGGINQIGGRHSNGSRFMRDLPLGQSLTDWHNLAITWDPTNATSLPATLWFDGVSLGSTYAFVGSGNNNGYVEFGDGNSGAGGLNPQLEVDWIRFGTDLTVVPVAVPEPAGMGLLLAGSLLSLRRRRA